MIDVRDGLNQIITERGFNRAAIARKAEITPDKLSSILTKKRKLEANDMLRLCFAMGINPLEIVKSEELTSN